MTRSYRARFPRSSVFAALLLTVGCSCSPAKSQPNSSLPTASATATTAVSQASDQQDDLPDLPRDQREGILSEAAESLLGKEHVLRKPIDESVSREAFPKYIESLDGAKLLFLQSEVDALARVGEKSMGDELRDGDLVLARKGSALVQERRKLVSTMVADILSKPFDFTVKESLETDPKKREFCKTDKELADRWREELKLQALERLEQMQEILDSKNKPPKPDAKKDADPEDVKKRDAATARALAEIPATPEAREEKVRKDLATRYQARFTRLLAPERLEPADKFINAINAVYDPHTEYMPPAEKADFDIAISGTLEGIGAALGEQDHFVVVSDLIPGGASWQQGRLEAGDLIVAVAQQDKDPIDVTDMPLEKVVGMIRGPKGTVVTLTVKKPDGHMESIAITRDVIHVEATYARGALLKLPAKNGKKRPPVGYIYLPGFYGEIGSKPQPGERNATEDVRALLLELQKKGASSIILDLRGNGGGILSHARDITGLFIKEGPVVQTRDAAGEIEVLSDKDPSVTYSGNVVVMVDRFSASAAEILAGALQDYERAVIVGTSATHGKGTVQAVVDLDRLRKGAGDPLGVYKITTQEYFRVSGGSTQLKGVMPDVLMPDPSAFIDSGEATLFHPIPWTSIKPAPFAKVDHKWKGADLAAASKARTDANAELTKVSAFSKAMKSRRDRTVEPLDKTGFEAERAQDKAALDATDPKIKEQKPLMDVEVVADAKELAAPTDKKLAKRLDAWKDDLARDPWVDESVNVLEDMAAAH